jgi:uncharacterized protein YggE
MEGVMAALTSSGIDKKDIQTQYYNVYQYVSQVTIKTGASASRPETQDSNTVTAVPVDQVQTVVPTEEITGYEVSNMLTVKIRSVENAGAIIDSVVAAGGDNIRMNGISFSVENPSQYYAEARNLAMQDASNKAQKLAELSGVKLGKATYVTESVSSQPYPYLQYKSYDMVSSGGGASISAGETDVVLNIQVSYSIY